MSSPNGRYQFQPGGVTRDWLFSASGCPKRRPDRSLNARYTTTALAAPDATAADGELHGRARAAATTAGAGGEAQLGDAERSG